MQTNVYLPQLELTMADVTVASVLVNVGDWLTADQPLIEVETEKALQSVPSPKAGCVRQLFVKPGQQLGEKALLCILTDRADEPLENSLTSRSPPAASVQLAGRTDGQSTAAAAAPASEPSEALIKAAPAARKLAKDRGLDLAAITGTGPGGRITVDDVQKAS